MPLIGTQSPWAVGADAASNGANQLAQTLMRLPLLKQQLAQGNLQQQLLQGQVAFQPQQQQGAMALNQARVGEQNALAGANTARGGLYDAQTKQRDVATHTAEGQNSSLAALQQTLAKITMGDQSPQTLAELQKSFVGLDPKIMGKVADSVLQAKGLMNNAVMNDPRMQAGALLGNKTVANGVNVNANAVNFPPGGGAPAIGMLRTSPGQQVTDPNTGVNIADNQNKNGAQSSGLAIAALRAAVADANNINPQQVIAAAQQYQQALSAPQQQPTPGTNQSVTRKFTWTPQGLVPQQ